MQVGRGIPAKPNMKISKKLPAHRKSAFLGQALNKSETPYVVAYFGIGLRIGQGRFQIRETAD
jgi:hypothetical protein